MHGNNNGGATDRDELIALNQEFGEAEKRRDTPFFQSVLSDDLIFRRANGLAVNKKIFLADLASPDNSYERLVSEDVEASVYEGVAVVSLRVRAKGKRCSAEFEGVFRNVRVFVKESQGWQCAGWFNTRIE